jgi:hypothetical protein
LVTWQLKVSVCGPGYIQLLGKDGTIFKHIGYVHMTQLAIRLGFKIDSTATVLRKSNIDGWNRIHTQCPARHGRVKKGLEKNIYALKQDRYKDKLSAHINNQGNILSDSYGTSPELSRYLIYYSHLSFDIKATY